MQNLSGCMGTVRCGEERQAYGFKKRKNSQIFIDFHFLMMYDTIANYRIPFYFGITFMKEVYIMAKLDLTKYGITGATEIIHNPSYETLFEAEMDPTLEGFEKGQLTELGAVNVMTGIYTGRSPKDKFIVMDENSKDTVWWTSKEFANRSEEHTSELQSR